LRDRRASIEADIGSISLKIEDQDECRAPEHLIREDARPVEHCHINPLKHGPVERVRCWPYSSFHGDVGAGVLPVDWGGHIEAIGEANLRAKFACLEWRIAPSAPIHLASPDPTYVLDQPPSRSTNFGTRIQNARSSRNVCYQCGANQPA
jgi:hypothetical protein